MVNLTSLAALTTAGFLLLGRTEAMIVARGAGYMAGKSVVLLRRARDVVSGLGKHGELSQLHKELNDGVREIRQIRNELTGVTSYRPSMQDLITPSPTPPPPTLAAAHTSTAATAARTTTTTTTAAAAATANATYNGITAASPPGSHASTAATLSPPTTSDPLSHDTLFSASSPTTATPVTTRNERGSTSPRVSDVPGMGKVEHEESGGISFNLPAMDARDMFPKSQSFEMDKRHSAADLISDAILESYTPKVKISEEELDLINQQSKGAAS